MRETVIIDLDGTIIKGQSQRLLLDFLFKKRIISPFQCLKIYLWFIFYKTGLAKNPENIMRYAFSFFAGKAVGEIDEIIDDFFETVLKKFIFQEMIDIINKHRKENRELLIVSNAAVIIVQKIARFLDIKNCIGTRLEIVNNKFTGNILGDIVYGKNKIKSAVGFLTSHNLLIEDCWVYADHISDLPLLEIANCPIVVNADGKLYKEAKKRNWQTLIFKKTIKI